MANAAVLVRLRRTQARSLPLSWVAPVCVVLLATALPLVLRLHVPIDFYDEGVILQGAERIARGGLPYRDFQAVYAPGQFYIVAAAFRTFGITTLTERLVDCAERLALALALYACCRCFASRRFATVAASIIAAGMTYYANFGYPTLPALATAFWCGALLCRGEGCRSAWRATAAGVCAGLTALIRLDFGIYLLLAAGVTLLADAFARRREGRGVLVPAAVFGVAAAATAGVPFVLLLHAVPARLVWQETVVFPATKLHGERALPYPTPLSDLRALLAGHLIPTPHAQLLHLLFYGSLALSVCEAWLLARSSASADDASQRIRLFCAVFGLALMAQALSRFDEAHLLPTALCAAVLLASRLERHRPWRRGTRLRVPILLGLTWAITLGLALTLVGISFALRNAPPWRCLSTIARASCAWLLPEQQDALRYVQNTTPPGAPIFVTNWRNDLGANSDAMFSFLAERPSPGPYNHFEPGISNTAPVQREEIAAIEAADVRTIVRVEVTQKPEPNGSNRSSGVTLIDDYIVAHYQPVYANDVYTVLQRVEAPPR
jgi:hypothetical protein